VLLASPFAAPDRHALARATRVAIALSRPVVVASLAQAQLRAELSRALSAHAATIVVLPSGALSPRDAVALAIEHRVPVLVSRAPPGAGAVLVGLDESQSPVRWAHALATERPLVVVHRAETVAQVTSAEPSMTTRVDIELSARRRFAPALAALRPAPELVLARAAHTAADAIVFEAHARDEVDLVVVGARRRAWSFLERARSRTSARVLELTFRSVLIVPE
jgi:hypothetical protein